MKKKNRTRIDCFPEDKREIKKYAAEIDSSIPAAISELVKGIKEKKKGDKFKVGF